MSTRSITVTAVAAAVLAIGAGTALATGAGAAQPAGVTTLASATVASSQPAAVPPGTTIDRAAAERTAVRVAGGGVVTDSELDDRDDDGDPREWEIDVRNGNVVHEIEIDAATGEATEHDRDTAGEADDRDDD